MGCIGCVRYENSDATSWHELLHYSARFAPSFVRQPNGPESTQIVRNAPKRQFRAQWGGSGAFVAKHSDTTSWHELFTSSARCQPSFVRQPNGPECTKIVRNTPNYKFRIQCGDWMRSLREILMRLRGTNFSTSSTRCAPSFGRQPNSPEFTQIV